MSANPYTDLLALFGVGCPSPPDMVPLRILGLAALPENTAALRSAFRDKVKAIHPNSTRVPDDGGAVSELVWAKAVLLPKVPESVTDTDITRRPDISRHTPPRCEVCGREGPVTHWRNRFAGYCWACTAAAENALRRERRAASRANRTCQCCGEVFTPTRSDGRYCSGACRQRAYRTRREQL